MVFTDQDDNTAHAQQLSDLPTPQQLAGTSWIVAVEGADVIVQFRRDGTVEFGDDTTTCAAGRYTYDAGILELDLDPAPDRCPDARLDELIATRLNVAAFSDTYMADTILLVPATGGATRLFPAGGDSSDAATASTIETVDGSTSTVSRSVPPRATPSTSPDRTDPIDGPVLRSLFDNGDEMDAIVQGTLALEGNCLVLQHQAATGAVTASYPVVWPANTSWQADPPTVVLANGDRIPLGAQVSGGGGYLSEGIVAEMVGEAVAEAAAACIGPTGEIAFFNAGAYVEIQPD